jgi:sec-independent protein translocase protein TatB
MFDLDAGKLIVIGIVALIAIPSKDLPRVLRQLGQMTGKMRRMAAEFQGQFMEAMREAELQDLQQDLKSEVDKVKESVQLNGSFDPLGEARKQIAGAIEARPLDREPSGSRQSGEPEGSRSGAVRPDGSPPPEDKSPPGEKGA